MGIRFLLFLIALIVGVAGSSSAQQASVARQQDPLYSGDPILVRVTTKGFDEDPQPTCEPGKLPLGLTLQSVGVRPSISSMTQVINGEVTSYRKVVYTYDFHLVAEKPGNYTLPPFTVKQKQRAVVTQPLNLQVQKIGNDNNMRASLVLPSAPVYTGQRVPIKIEWWYAGDPNDVRERIFRAPLFEQFSFITEPVAWNDTFLLIATKKGTIKLKARREKRKLNGREFLVVTASPLLVATQSGEYDLAPITVTMNRVTRWGRDVFGRKQPTAKVRLRAVDEARRLVIRPLPLDQAPASFAGAIGRGFNIRVEADRTVVRVGDPITLKIHLRGDGSLKSAALPSMSADYNLDSKRFRWPEGEIPGIVSGEVKSFSVTVRVLDESVAEIPPLAYSWFDPQLGQFQTARSDPIALRVQSAQMVRAQDVVSGAPKEQEQALAEQERGATSGGWAAVGSTRRYDLTGADLAIESSTDKLLINESQRYGGGLVRAGIYAAAPLLVVFAWFWRRRAEVDPEIHRRRKVVREQVEQVRQAAGLPRQEAAGQISAALRKVAAHANGAVRGEVDNLLTQCDNLAYAPVGGGAEPIDGELHRRALQVAQAMAKDES